MREVLPRFTLCFFFLSGKELKEIGKFVCTLSSLRTISFLSRKRAKGGDFDFEHLVLPSDVTVMCFKW